MSWPGFQFEQEDLYARSREPAIHEREYFRMNHLYGGAEVLRQYAGLPADHPIPWALQPIMTFFNDAERDSLESEVSKRIRMLQECGMPYCFTITESYADMLREKGISGVVEIGSMFFYARELYRRTGLEDGDAPRRGTIALPDKSDLNRLLDFDREAYAQKLAALPEEYQPVYVSMHWRDYERGCHEPYLKAGLKMVCSGHPNDPLFYQRLYDVCRRFKYSCSNEISTSFVLSTLSGCQFFYLDGGEVTIQRQADSPVYVGQEPSLDDPGRRACVEASPFPPSPATSGLQQTLAAAFVGREFMKQPEFFREHWELARDALSSRLTPEDLDMDQPPAPAVFARWLPCGLDADGWSDQQSSLEIPSPGGFAAVELRLELASQPADAPSLSISFSLDGGAPQVVSPSASPTQARVRVPLGGQGERRKVTFFGPESAKSLADGRQRSFRLAGIHWEPSLQPQSNGENLLKNAPQEEKNEKAGVLARFLKFWR